MTARRFALVSSAVDQRGGAAAAGAVHHQGHAELTAAAWIETLHSRAQRSAERHLRSA